jgi:energy-coupling factor transporter transmembrane protein EcfT
MEDALTFVIICAVILAGFYLRQIWISIIFALILVLVMIFGRKTPSAAPSGGGGGPKVRPIIVKRKYVGPESIYPKKMLIKYQPDTPSDWREYGPEAVGNFVGSGAKWLKSLFK